MSNCVIPLEVWERFWSHVDKNGPPQPHMATPCHVWTAAKDRDGYGSFKFRGRQTRAHRFALGLPEEQVLHHCDNRACVREDHLYKGTTQQNSRDMVQRGRTASGGRNGSRLYPERLRRGRQVHLAKLDEEKVRLIRRLYAGGVLQQELADRFGVVNQLISAVVNRKVWAHVT